MKKNNKLISEERALSIIKKPMTTEKTTTLNQFNQYSFIVSKDSSSNEIKSAIEKIFKVKVIKINTINRKAKTKIVRGKLGFKKGFKKAVITLKKGQSIDLGSGA